MGKKRHKDTITEESRPGEALCMDIIWFKPIHPTGVNGKREAHRNIRVKQQEPA